MKDIELLVVDNSLDHELYRPVEHWTDAVGFTPDSVHPPSGEDLPDKGRYTHIILTGCEGSITDMPSWAQRESTWLRSAIDAGAAVLGSCWGHQLIAVTFAGLEGVKRAAAPEFGWVEIPVSNGGGLLPNETIQTFTSHFDEVVPDCHPDLRILATTPSCTVQAAQWGDRPVWGIQPHPEISPERGTAFLSQAATLWPDAAIEIRRALARPVRDSDAGKPIARRFLETPAGRFAGSR